MTMLRGVLVLAAAVVALGCAKKEDAAAKDIGQQTADITADTETLKEANAAVSEVVRNAGECEAARAAVPGANQKLDEVAGRVRTATGRQTLEALRGQVKRVSDMCG
jgi:hypothetical protein